MVEPAFSFSVPASSMPHDIKTTAHKMRENPIAGDGHSVFPRASPMGQRSPDTGGSIVVTCVDIRHWLS